LKFAKAQIELALLPFIRRARISTGLKLCTDCLAKLFARSIHSLKRIQPQFSFMFWLHLEMSLDPAHRKAAVDALEQALKNTEAKQEKEPKTA
jgi:hypothetical protein